MIRKKILTGLAVSAVLAASFVTAVKADVWNKKTIVTFSEAVELPGKVVVPAGEYVFKLADSMSNRHIVQVMNKDEDKVFATILAIPRQRQQPADKTVMTFYETPKDQPVFIRTWFYPGETIGQEFAYPKERASHIAKLSKTNVPLAPSEDSGEIASLITPTDEEIAVAQEQSRVTEQTRTETTTEQTRTEQATAEQTRTERAAAVEPAPAPEPTPAPEPAPAPEPSQEVAAQPQQAAEEHRAEAVAQDTQADSTRRAGQINDMPDELPSTASGLPLLALSGVLFMSAAGMVRRQRR